MLVRQSAELRAFFAGVSWLVTGAACSVVFQVLFLFLGECEHLGCAGSQGAVPDMCNEKLEWLRACVTAGLADPWQMHRLYAKWLSWVWRCKACPCWTSPN